MQEGLPDLLASLARSHEDQPRGLSARKMVALALTAALGAAFVVATLLWFDRRDFATFFLAEDNNAQPASDLTVAKVKARPPAPVADMAPSEPAAATPHRTVSVTPGSVLQLGAYRNQEQAERAWAELSARFPSVARMTKLVLPFPGGFRLRATGSSSGEAKRACQTLKAAGQNCFVAQ